MGPFRAGRGLCTTCTQPVHRRSAAWAFLGLLGLAGCAAVAPPASDALRDEGAVLAGTTRFDAARFAGDWQTVACIGTCAEAAQYSVATDDAYVRVAGGDSTGFDITAPGVLHARGGGQTLVVMWVDDGFRTAAVGDAAGTWAAVIDRARPGGADRVKAAREILDFNGWDVSQIQRVEG
ncbi:lipocalin [uncultured Sulfitobacter sp.]|uniref:lipocalin n=1 Tax=uncultured Sulfitobacter sp. TaxID=191468 RepID=UPI002623D252|nr:lipocalin [uncultured Sulfitobacter sp.]